MEKHGTEAGDSCGGDYQEGIRCRFLLSAHDEAGALAGRHLAEQGYEEYLFLGNTRDMKYRGFVDALAKIRPDFGAHLTVITTKKTEEIRQALEEHFKKTDHCTGIFTYNDRRAIQALGILEEMGIRIPEQAGVLVLIILIYVNICIRGFPVLPSR